MPTLTNNQQIAVDTIKKALGKYKGFILADRPGYGKTAPAIQIGKIAQKYGPVLVICPAYIALNWLEELTLWGIERPDICIIDSTKQILDDCKWYVVSYNMASYMERTRHKNGSITKKPGLIFQQLYAKKWGLIIADEMHAMKSSGALRSRLILGTGNNKQTNLLNRTYKFIGLTGTPLINRVDELYNLLIKIAPAIFKGASRMQFILHFAAHVENTPWGIKHHGVKNVEELKALIAPVMLARTAIDGLTDRIDKYIPLQIKGKDQENFIKQETEFIQRHNLTAENLDRLQNIKDLEGPTIAEIRQATALYKIPAVMAALDDHIEKDEGPLIIGVYHKAVLTALKTEIEKKYKKIRLAIITGEVDKKKRHAIIQKYQKGDIDILLTTISSMREGVNVTRGQNMYIVEYPWTPAELEQYIARIHRKGQAGNVYIQYFSFTGGIDKIMSECLKRKSTMIKKIME